MKKNKIQNIIIICIVSIIIGTIVVYNYSAEQTKQQGLQFGKELEQIQEEVRELQTKFYSEKTKWDEGDISKEELIVFYEKHLKDFDRVISKYDNLISPEGFKSSVELLKLSSETQLESDKQFIEWIETGDNSAKIRSDTQFQDALEYEMSGLVEFYSAKTGANNYEESEEFEPPERGLVQKVIQIYKNKEMKCNSEFKNKLGEFDSEQIEVDWFNCINEAKKWKTEHMP